MADLFTPAEANALYNKCKIAYDPRSYSLKDSLKLSVNIRDMARHHITNAEYGAELALINAIQAFHKNSSGTTDVKSVFESTGKTAGGANCSDVQPTDVALCKRDDMYIALDYLKALGLTDSMLKHGQVLEAIVQTCVALASPKSCCADIHWVACQGFEKDSYEDLHTFKQLNNALATKSKHIPVNIHYTQVLAQCVPAPSVISKGDAAISTLGLDTAYAGQFDKDTVATQMLYTMFYTLEVLWAIKSLSDSKLRAIMQQYVSTMSSGVSELEKLFYTISHTVMALNPDVEALTDIESPKERFDAYRAYALKENFNAEAQKLASLFLAGSPEAIIPAGLGTLVGYAQTLSNTWVRVNSCRILYEYAAANHLLDEEESFDSSEFLDDLRDLSISAGSSATSFTTTASVEKEKADLMDLTVGHKSTGMPGSVGATSYISPTYEALDKAKAKYIDGRYTFDTTDYVDFSDSARAKYETIAKKASLVNRLLTQKLREIKTYNTGGKQAGLPSGRLDRKAVYRYKYDGNIFYNNTYKQLESDLAFGVILDISGSMHGKGIENGRITMIVLHETLKALGINHSIIGHTSQGRYQCTIERYQSFREDKTYHTRKNYALAELDAKRGNCDSASLYYMEQALLRTRNRDKICVIFSDGQPTECTGTDLKEQVAHMERNGIKVIGIGIDFPEIADYYKDYANGRNLADMLKIVTKILKEYILKKKERA